VVLSRYDENTVPTSFSGPGKKLLTVESSICFDWGGLDRI
jgi:hypothetical protein